MRRPRRLRPGTLRARLALLAAAASLGVVLLSSGVLAVVTGRVLTDVSAEQLRTVRAEVGRLVAEGVLTPQELCTLVSREGPGPPLPLSAAVLVEVERPDGTACRAPGATSIGQVDERPGVLPGLLGADLPVGSTSADAPVLVAQTDLGGGWRLRVGRDLGEYEVVAGRLRNGLWALVVGGTLLALVVGYLVARSGLRPVGRLADVAERIARTGDLTHRVDVPRGSPDDEVTRLASSFDAMTSALLAARERQARLVADASHELRTPLTSLRTNVDLLLRSEAAARPLPADHRRELLGDLRDELAELGRLAEELTTLAHEEPPGPRGPVRLDEVLAEVVERARRRADGHVLQVDVRPWLVADGDRPALTRAVVNVLDNALKFSPPGSTVRVRLTGGRLEVDDEGPGIRPADRQLAFERFWRADDARALSGSGLGLAIVADAVADHGGTVDLGAAPGGGTRVTITLPGRPA